MERSTERVQVKLPLGDQETGIQTAVEAALQYTDEIQEE